MMNRTQEEEEKLKQDTDRILNITFPEMKNADNPEGTTINVETAIRHLLHLDQKLIRKLYDVYKLDFQLFGYDATPYLKAHDRILIKQEIMQAETDQKMKIVEEKLDEAATGSIEEISKITKEETNINAEDLGKEKAPESQKAVTVVDESKVDVPTSAVNKNETNVNSKETDNHTEETDSIQEIVLDNTIEALKSIKEEIEDKDKISATEIKTAIKDSTHDILADAVLQPIFLLGKEQTELKVNQTIEQVKKIIDKPSKLLQNFTENVSDKIEEIKDEIIGLNLSDESHEVSSIEDIDNDGDLEMVESMGNRLSREEIEQHEKNPDSEGKVGQKADNEDFSMDILNMDNLVKPVDLLNGISEKRGVTELEEGASNQEVERLNPMTDPSRSTGLDVENLPVEQQAQLIQHAETIMRQGIPKQTRDFILPDLEDFPDVKPQPPKIVPEYLDNDSGVEFAESL